MQQAIQLATNALNDHAIHNMTNNLDPATHLIPRSPQLLQLITTAYGHFQEAIDYTVNTINATMPPPTHPAECPTPLPQHIDITFQRITATTSKLRSHYTKREYKPVPSTINHLHNLATQLHQLCTKHATKLTAS